MTVRDAFGREIKPGDIVVYPSAKYGSLKMSLAVVRRAEISTCRWSDRQFPEIFITRIQAEDRRPHWRTGKRAPRAWKGSVTCVSRVVVIPPETLENAQSSVYKSSYSDKIDIEATLAEAKRIRSVQA